MENRKFYLPETCPNAIRRNLHKNKSESFRCLFSFINKLLAINKYLILDLILWLLRLGQSLLSSANILYLCQWNKILHFVNNNCKCPKELSLPACMHYWNSTERLLLTWEIYRELLLLLHFAHVGYTDDDQIMDFK